MWTSSERRRSSFGQHGLVNRSDSEKLGDVNLILNPEIHLQSVFAEENLSVKHVDANSVSLDEMEYFDVPQSPYWAPRVGGKCGGSSSISGNGNGNGNGNGGSVGDSEYGRPRSSSVLAAAAAAASSDERTSKDGPMTYRQGSLEVAASNVAAASIEDKEERILEVLREIVRKCSNPVSTLRPTAGQVLNIFDANIHMRDK